MEKFYVAAKALIEKDKKILVLRVKVEDREYTTLPGGRIEGNEKPEEALKREVQEELGVNSEIGEQVGTWWFYREDGDRVFCLTYRVKISEEPKVQKQDGQEEIEEYIWISKEDFVSGNYIVDKNNTKSLHRFIKNIE